MTLGSIDGWTARPPRPAPPPPTPPHITDDDVREHLHGDHSLVIQMSAGLAARRVRPRRQHTILGQYIPKATG